MDWHWRPGPSHSEGGSGGSISPPKSSGMGPNDWMCGNWAHGSPYTWRTLTTSTGAHKPTLTPSSCE
eukprot:3123781-Prorocentrum_lima.AAC.1